jgi:hypothetical protein
MTRKQNSQSQPSQVPEIADCLICRQPFIRQWQQERRPVYESLKQMKAGGRSNQKRTGMALRWVLPATCELCREKEPETVNHGSQ